MPEFQVRVHEFTEFPTGTEVSEPDKAWIGAPLESHRAAAGGHRGSLRHPAGGREVCRQWFCH